MNLKTLNNKIYKGNYLNNINMIPGDRNGSPDEFFSLRYKQEDKLSWKIH